MTPESRARLAVVFANALGVGITACHGPGQMHEPLILAAPEEARRVTVRGVERLGYVLPPGGELSFEGTPGGRCDLVWTLATLGDEPARGSQVEVRWREEEPEGAAVLWRSDLEQPVRGWTEVRVPMDGRRVGTATFRLHPSADSGDSVVIVAPRFESPARRPDGVDNRYNIVLIVLDTFRLDHISRYGSTAVHTPHMDAFLDSTVEFTNAFTRSTFTMPSHVSMMTGLPPRCHGIRKNRQVLAPTIVTVPQLLHQAGYRTGAFFEIGTLQEPCGISPGFDSYVFCGKQQRNLLELVSGWLQSIRGERFLLFLNLATVHVPRVLPEHVWQLTCGLQDGPAFRLRADRDFQTVSFVVPPGTSELRFRAGRRSDRDRQIDTASLRMAMWNWRVTPEEHVQLRWGPDVERPDFVEYTVLRPEWTEDDVVFDGETTLSVSNTSQDSIVLTLRFKAYPDFYTSLLQDRVQYRIAAGAVDDLLGRLLQVVDRWSDPRRTAVILTSDHGEGLEDHRHRLHGYEVYDESSHVPLAIRLPDAEPRTVRGLVPLDAVAPTMLHLAAIEPPPWMIRQALLGSLWQPAPSLVSETFDPKSADEPIPVAGDRAIRTGRWSLVVDHVASVTRLFDRRSDPAETEDLASLLPGVADSLMRILESTTRRQNAVFMPGEVTEDSELRDALRALGYVH